jgi:hypothetical protein
VISPGSGWGLKSSGGEICPKLLDCGIDLRCPSLLITERSDCKAVKQKTTRQQVRKYVLDTSLKNCDGVTVGDAVTSKAAGL